MEAPLPSHLQSHSKWWVKQRQMAVWAQWSIQGMVYVRGVCRYELGSVWMHPTTTDHPRRTVLNQGCFEETFVMGEDGSYEYIHGSSHRKISIQMNSLITLTPKGGTACFGAHSAFTHLVSMMFKIVHGSPGWSWTSRFCEVFLLSSNFPAVLHLADSWFEHFQKENFSPTVLISRTKSLKDTLIEVYL